MDSVYLATLRPRLVSLSRAHLLNHGLLIRLGDKGLLLPRVTSAFPAIKRLNENLSRGELVLTHLLSLDHATNRLCFTISYLIAKSPDASFLSEDFTTTL
jgi:hypothetical protein